MTSHYPTLEQNPNHQQHEEEEAWDQQEDQANQFPSSWAFQELEKLGEANEIEIIGRCETLRFSFIKLKKKKVQGVWSLDKFTCEFVYHEYYTGILTS